MTHNAATAYACVAYRVMEYDREPLTEEQFEVVLEMLFGFYNEREIEKIYQQNIVFGSNDAIINEEKIKGKIEGAVAFAIENRERQLPFFPFLSIPK